MLEFGWTRLAYLTITLAVLAALVRLGPPGLTSLSNHLNGSHPTPFGKEAQARTSPEATSLQKTFPEGTTLQSTAPEGTTILQDTSSGEKKTFSHRRSSKERSGARGPKAAAGSTGSRRTSGGAGKVLVTQREVPTFYRSVPARSLGVQTGAAGSRSAGGKVCRNVGRAPAGSRIVFPVPRRYFNSFTDSWGAARVQGGHEGTDLMVPAGTPEFAMTDGVVVPVSGSNVRGWNYLGGYTVMVRASYSIGPVKAGDIFYYAHLNRPTALKAGERVKAGEVVGYAGDTGQGPEGTSGLFPPHLHFGWYDVTSGRSQVASGAMDPYPLLVWVEKNGGSVKGGSDAPFCEAPAPAAPTPANGGSWNFPSSPGFRPDLSTGTDSAAPTPAAPSRTSAESSPNVLREKTSRTTTATRSTATRSTATRSTVARKDPTAQKRPHAANRPEPKANVPKTTISRPPARKVRPQGVPEHGTPERGIAREVRKVGAEVSGAVRHLLHPTSGKGGKPSGRSGPPHQKDAPNGSPGKNQYRNAPEAPAAAGSPKPASEVRAPAGEPSACETGGRHPERHRQEGSGKSCGGSSSSGKPSGRSASPPAPAEKPGSGTATKPSGDQKPKPPDGGQSAPETTSPKTLPGDPTTGETTSGETTSGETTLPVESTGSAAPEASVLGGG